MLPETMPVCPVRGSVIYPTMVMPIDAGRPISIRAIDEALARDRVLLIVSQRDKEVETPRPSDLFEVGTACNILKMRKNPDGSVQVLVQAFARVRVREWLDLGTTRGPRRGPRRRARGAHPGQGPGPGGQGQFQALLKEGKYLAPEVAQFILNLEDPSQLADYVAFHMDFRPRTSRRSWRRRTWPSACGRFWCSWRRSSPSLRPSGASSSRSRRRLTATSGSTS